MMPYKMILIPYQNHAINFRSVSIFLLWPKMEMLSTFERVDIVKVCLEMYNKICQKSRIDKK